MDLEEVHGRTMHGCGGQVSTNFWKCRYVFNSKVISYYNLLHIFIANATYLSTCATVFGPYHWPMDLPSPTPI